MLYAFILSHECVSSITMMAIQYVHCQGLYEYAVDSEVFTISGRSKRYAYRYFDSYHSECANFTYCLFIKLLLRDSSKPKQLKEKQKYALFYSLRSE